MIEKYKGLRKATLLVASTLTVMAGAIIAPALPQISKEFSDVPGAELLSRLVLTLPALFMGILAPLAGYFTDKAGRKKVLLFSLILYAAAGTTGLYLNDLYHILAGRAILGIAVGALITSVITLIGDYFEGEERSRFMGLQAAFAGMGGLIFISLGGVLADINWRMPFLLYVASLIVWIMAIVSVYEPFKEQKSGPDQTNELKTGRRKVQITPVIWAVYAITFFSALIFYMIPTQMPFMLNALDGISNTRIGFAIAFVNVASVSTSLNYGKIKRIMSYPAIMALVYFLVFTGFLIISQAGSYVMMIVGIVFSGLGFGLMMPNLNLWLISLAPSAMRGQLVGYLNMALFLGMFGSPIAIQPLLRWGDLYNVFFILAILIFVLGFFFLIYSKVKQQKT
jgi:MFS family permease